jgi:hypothetical protein
MSFRAVVRQLLDKPLTNKPIGSERAWMLANFLRRHYPSRKVQPKPRKCCRERGHLRTIHHDHEKRYKVERCIHCGGRHHQLVLEPAKLTVTPKPLG